MSLCSRMLLIVLFLAASEATDNYFHTSYNNKENLYKNTTNFENQKFKSSKTVHYNYSLDGSETGSGKSNFLFPNNEENNINSLYLIPIQWVTQPGLLVFIFKEYPTMSWEHHFFKTSWILLDSRQYLGMIPTLPTS